MPSARHATARTARVATPGRPVPRPARRSARGPAAHRRLRVRWDRAGRVGLLVVLTVVLGLYVQHALAYLSIHAQASSQQALVDSLRRQNIALERERASLLKPATILRDARALGMVRPGERAYVITGQRSP